MRYTFQSKKILKKIFITLLFIMANINAQTEQWKFYYPEYNYLQDRNVYSIAIDSNGVKWFGTKKGFASFDGKNWKQFKHDEYNLPDSNIKKIVVDNNNCKWMATKNGLLKFNDTTITVFDTTNSALSDNYIYSIAMDDSNNIWVSTPNSIVRFTGNISEIITDSIRTPLVLKFDKKGNLWIAGDEKGLIKYDGTNFYYYNFIVKDQILAQIEKLDIDTAWNIWVNTNYGIAKFDGNNFSFYKEITDGQYTISTEDTYYIACDKEGNVLFNSPDYGIIKFNGTSFSFFRPQISNAKVGFFIDFCFDKNGTVWIGMMDDGVINIEGNQWTNYKASYGLPSETC